MAERKKKLQTQVFHGAAHPAQYSLHIRAAKKHSPGIAGARRNSGMSLYTYMDDDDAF